MLDFINPQGKLLYQSSSVTNNKAAELVRAASLLENELRGPSIVWWSSFRVLWIPHWLTPFCRQCQCQCRQLSQETSTEHLPPQTDRRAPASCIMLKDLSFLKSLLLTFLDSITVVLPVQSTVQVDSQVLFKDEVFHLLLGLLNIQEQLVCLGPLHKVCDQCPVLRVLSASDTPHCRRVVWNPLHVAGSGAVLEEGSEVERLNRNGDSTVYCEHRQLPI